MGKKKSAVRLESWTPLLQAITSPLDELELSFKRHYAMQNVHSIHFIGVKFYFSSLGSFNKSIGDIMCFMNLPSIFGQTTHHELKTSTLTGKVMDYTNDYHTLSRH